MKKILSNILFLITALSAVSCNGFLDTIPDNRAEITEESQIGALLVSAYPTVFPSVIWELSSDNITDNGPTLSFPYSFVQEAYLWKDITEVRQDTPYAIWNGLYGAIASANQALDYIEKWGNPASLSAERGEALMCRAYSHFLLAITFCLPYNPETADKDMGIPYITKPENTVYVNYDRGTLAETYRNIEKDILEGIDLLDDNSYTVPKYHFNIAAANAFAARFYLYYMQDDKSNFDKSLKYSDAVLGSDPVLKDVATILTSSNDFNQTINQYNSIVEKGNLFFQINDTGINQILGRNVRSYRFAFNANVNSAELFDSSENLWVIDRQTTVADRTLVGNSQINILPKFMIYREYSNVQKTNYYPHSILPVFTTNSLILDRAEAYIMKNNPDYEAAAKDLCTWLKSFVVNKNYEPKLTSDRIASFYANLQYSPAPSAALRFNKAKKMLNPYIPFVDSKQENMMHAVLGLRRAETIHEGWRWQDIRRYGIEVTHFYGNEARFLPKNDARRAIQLPEEAINNGLKKN